MKQLELIGVEGLPEVRPGDDLARLIHEHATLRAADVVVVAQKVVSKSEGRLVDIARYGTRPAAVIVVPVPGTATLRVWVVGPGCTGQGGDVMAQLSMPAPG